MAPKRQMSGKYCFICDENYLCAYEDHTSAKCKKLI